MALKTLEFRSKWTVNMKEWRKSEKSLTTAVTYCLKKACSLKPQADKLHTIGIPEKVYRDLGVKR